MRWLQQLQWRYRKWQFRRHRSDRDGVPRPGTPRPALAAGALGALFAGLAARNWHAHHGSLIPAGDPRDVAHPLSVGLALLVVGALLAGSGQLRKLLGWAAATLFVLGVVYLQMSFMLLLGSWLAAWPLALVVFLALILGWSWWLGRQGGE